MHRILVLASLAYILGVLTVTLHPFIFFLLLLGGLIFYCLFYLSLSPYRPLITLLILALAYGSGVGRSYLEVEKVQQILAELGQNVSLTVQVCAEPQKYPHRYLYFTKVKEKAYRGKLLVSVLTEKALPYQYGDILNVEGVLELPPRAKNPGEFDYREYLKRQGVTAQVTVQPGDIKLVSNNNLNPFMHAAIWAKERTQKNINRLLPETEANLFNSIFFGDKGLLTKEQKTSFSQLGIMHIFAVSGSNVALVLVVLIALAIALKLSTFWRNVLLLFGLLFYPFLTGLTPSVLRASIMAGVVVLAQWLLREADFYSSLAFSALILLFWNPFNLFDSGFQLSYLVTWGLVYLHPLFEKLFSFLPGKAYLTVTLTSQLAALPLTAYYFNLISLAALAVNLLVVPVMGIVVNLGMFVFLLSFIWTPLAWPFIYTSGVIINLLLKFLQWAGSLPGVAIKVATPSIALVMVSYLFLICLVELNKEKTKKLAVNIFLALLGICILVAYLLPSRPHGLLEVTFLDVGQGDAIYIQTPEGRRFLIDGGGTNFTGTFNAGESIVVPYLTRRGIFKLDGVINTHPDGDHLLGLLPVLEEVDVALALTPPAHYFDNAYQEWGELLARENIPWKVGKAGQSLTLDKGQVKLEILHPGEEPVMSRRSFDNDNSLVLKLSYGNFSCLLTGDVEEDGLAAMLDQGGDFSCTVFKAPHHGSKYAFNEGFYLEADPQIVVFSVGKNSFGHPAAELINYWEKRNVTIYRTDYDGAVTFLTDGKKLKVKTMGRSLF